MKKDEIKIGHTYSAKVSDRIVTVRIDSTNTHGGWNATNTTTGKRIRIKSAQRLRRAVNAGKEPAAVAAADQENARARDERGAAPDGMTASERAMAETAGKKPRARKPAAEPKAKRVSALDAAAEVLRMAGKPMRSQELITAMAEQGLWQSPNGQTPASTLYAAVLREVRDKGASARFRKVDRGLFEYAG